MSSSPWSSGYVTDIAYTHGYYEEFNPNGFSFSLLQADMPCGKSSMPVSWVLDRALAWQYMLLQQTLIGVERISTPCRQTMRRSLLVPLA